MNGTDTQSNPRPCGDDVAAYALGALDPVEAEAFRTHLEACAVCRDELAAFGHVVEVMPLSATPHRAPRRLRRRVLDSVQREPMLELRGERGYRRARALPLRARLASARPALALGVAVVVAALVVGGIELGGSSAVKTRVYPAQVTGPGSAHIALTGDHAELIVHHFPPPPAGKIYEVWIRRPHGKPQPTSALFSVTDGDVEVPGNLRGVDQVMVTPEPAGGSRVPTGAPVIQAQLS